MSRSKKTAHTKRLNYGIYLQYRDYKKRDDLKHPVVDRETHKRVLRKVYERIHQEMILNLMIFKAPMGYGEFFVKQSYSKRGGLDFPKSKEKYEAGEEDWRVYKTNRHTNGRKFKFMWFKYGKDAKSSYVRQYLFQSYEGRAKDRIGKRGLHAEIMDRAKDPYKKPYSAYLG